MENGAAHQAMCFHGKKMKIFQIFFCITSSDALYIAAVKEQSASDG
jgi:hypothetical protein